MITALQALLVVLWYSAYKGFADFTGIYLTAGGIVLNGIMTGLIMGDPVTGFYLGGTYELMNIGLNPLGGSTVPDYNIGAIVGTAFGAVAGVETGMAVGIVVGTLASTLDVLCKMLGSFFMHKSKDYLAKQEFTKACAMVDLGFGMRILCLATVPLALVFIFGEPIVQAINNVVPDWLLTGFKNAGSMLPAIGFAILLRSMNLKGNWQFLLLGFFLYAYLNVGALGAAMVGIVIAYILYQYDVKLAQAEANAGGVDDE